VEKPLQQTFVVVKNEVINYLKLLFIRFLDADLAVVAAQFVIESIHCCATITEFNEVRAAVEDFFFFFFLFLKLGFQIFFGDSYFFEFGT
jgi:hypothetical protein